MQLNIEARQEGDVITLTLLNGVGGKELLKLLRSEGIEITIDPIKASIAEIEIRAPKRMLIAIGSKD